ncbi:uncharacterized protein N7469_008982, partial [Penicillium citrinum]
IIGYFLDQDWNYCKILLGFELLESLYYNIYLIRDFAVFINASPQYQKIFLNIQTIELQFYILLQLFSVHQRNFDILIIQTEEIIIKIEIELIEYIIIGRFCSPNLIAINNNFTERSNRLILEDFFIQ